MLSQTTNAMRIVGSEGHVILPACFWDTDQALVYRNNSLVKHLDISHPVNGFEYQIEQSMQSVAQNKLCSEVMSHQDSIDVMKVMDEIRRLTGVRYPANIEAFS